MGVVTKIVITKKNLWVRIWIASIEFRFLQDSGGFMSMTQFKLEQAKLIDNYRLLSFINRAGRSAQKSDRLFTSRRIGVDRPLRNP